MDNDEGRCGDRNRLACRERAIGLALGEAGSIMRTSNTGVIRKEASTDTNTAPKTRNLPEVGRIRGECGPRTESIHWQGDTYGSKLGALEEFNRICARINCPACTNAPPTVLEAGIPERPGMDHVRPDLAASRRHRQHLAALGQPRRVCEQCLGRSDLNQDEESGQIGKQRRGGALDLVLVQGRLTGMPAEVFVLRLRATRSAGGLWWSGWAMAPGRPSGRNGGGRRGSLPGRRAGAATAGAALRVRGAGADGPGRARRADPGGGRRQGEPVAAGGRVDAPRFTAFVASDGDEAVRLAGHDSFDAILMDIQMPHRDGFEATRRIRGMSGRVATIPIIALTGLKGPVMRKRCAEAGFTAVLEKPVNLDRSARHCAAGCRAEHRRRCRAIPGRCRSRTRARGITADVSQVFLEEMVAVVGLDRARACVADFVADASARCLRLGELLPGWEAGTIVRNCEEISGLAETCGAVGLGEVLEEIADAVTRSDRPRAERLVERLEH